ncbi:unnamed protein product [Linum tenue]|uniref:SOSEKI DIX-like domain-containing protein n=1 Tax=Linum tenue TaxID=586396 RepID=A0AAV0HSN0_9ROSI|nr:unnamed protein product [Linum tenue]
MESAAASMADAGTNPAASGRREGEVRRLHIIYFLARMGCIEHPHLIRVHHLNRNGVFLRDVKRWMGELRGKDMPDSFSWSYKRRYKSGYVWQDLMDEDLITPISDNEYVLKGSEISVDRHFDACKDTRIPSSPSSSTSSSPRDSDCTSEQQAPDQHHPTTNRMIINSPTSLATYPSLSTAYSFEHYPRETVRTSAASYNAQSTSSSPHPLQSPSSSRRKRSHKHSNPIVSRILRKLTTCEVVDTDDTALVVLNKSSSRTPSSRQSSTWKKQVDMQSISSATNHKVVTAETELELKLHSRKQHDNSSARDDYEGIKGSTKAQRQPARFCRDSDVSAAYRPVGAPTCMQCGKSFRPEKLHLHMIRSCKGTRLTKKYATSPVNPDNITRNCESIVLAATSLPEVFSN